MNIKGKNKTIVLDELQIAQVEALAAFLNIEQIAKYLNFSASAFYRIKKRQPEVLGAYERGVVKAHAFVGSTLMGFIKEKINTPTKLNATMFYLRTQAGWAEKTQINMTAKDVTLQPLQINFIVNEKPKYRT
jgi:hypothetical protein